MKINFKSIRNLSENKINSFVLCEYSEPQQIVIVSLARWRGSQWTRTRISQKRYEIERKCQWELDRKSYMGFQMVEIFLTSRDP